MPLDVMRDVVHVEVYRHPGIIWLIVLRQLLKRHTIRKLLNLFDLLGIRAYLVLGMHEELDFTTSGFEFAVVINNASYY